MELFKNCPIPDQLCLKYICASYLYYEKDFSVMSDTEFDNLCLELYNCFEDTTRWANCLIDKEALLAGTGFYLFGKLPDVLLEIANIWKSGIEKLIFEPGPNPKRK